MDKPTISYRYLPINNFVKIHTRTPFKLRREVIKVCYRHYRYIEDNNIYAVYIVKLKILVITTNPEGQGGLIHLLF